MSSFSAVQLRFHDPRALPHDAADPLVLRRAPLFFAALAFVAGILCARQWHAPAMLAAETLLLLLLSALSLRRAPRVASLPILAIWLAAGCWSAQVERPIDRQIGLQPFADGLLREVHGRVLAIRPHASADRSDRIAASPMTPAEPWLQEPGAWEDPTGSSSTSLDLALDSVEQLTPDRTWQVPVRGAIRLTVVGPLPTLRCGDRLTLDARLHLPETYRDPGVWDASEELLREGIGALASSKAASVRVTPATPNLRCRIRAAQSWVEARITRASAPTAFSRHLPRFLQLTPEDAGLLRAMLAGDRSGLGANLRAGLERTGTFHLFVISGLHVAMLSGLVLLLMRRLTPRKPPAFLVSALATAAFALLSGLSAAALRSLLMCLLYGLGWVLLRRGPPNDTSRGLNVLGGAVLLILLPDPRALYGAGFQMTALVILATAGLVAPITRRTFGPWWRSLSHENFDSTLFDLALPPHLASFRINLRFWGEIAATLLGPRFRALPRLLAYTFFATLELALANLAIELAMSLPMALYFHRANPLAVLTNLLVVPLAPFLLGSAALFFLASLLHPALAALPAAVCAALLHLARGIVGRFGSLAAAELRLPGPSAPGIALALLAFALAILLLRSRPRPWLLAGSLAAAAIPLAALWPVRPTLHPGLLEVTSIDVGQGDSEFIVSPLGQTLLVDGGGPVGRLTASTRWEIGEDVVAPYLWSRHLRHLDVLAVSHGHSDHIGGLPAVLRDLRPRELWLSPEPGHPAALAALVLEAQSLGVTVRRLRAGDAFPWGGLQVAVLAPEPSYENTGEPTNNDSLVFQLGFGEARALLEGDAEAPSEHAMLENNRLHPVTLLKVGHHGSRTSTTPALVAALQPKVAVISVGRRNTFGHPRPEVLTRLSDAGSRVWRTDREGAVTFLLHPDGRIETHPALSQVPPHELEDRPQ